MSRLEHQRSRRFAKIKNDPDGGMTVLHGRFDPVAGARIEAVLSKKMDDLWREDRDRGTRPGQRMADALEQLLTRPGGEEDGPGQGVKLLITAEYDVVAQEVGKVRLPDGTPLPADELRRFACEAQVLPAICSGEPQPLDLGRSRRLASGAQRAVLVARDRRCVGCGVSASCCQAHHIVFWRRGSRTDIDNLVLLCSPCHHKVHDIGWRVERVPGGKYRLRRPPTPVRTATPTRLQPPVPTPQTPTGDRTKKVNPTPQRGLGKCWTTHPVGRATKQRARCQQRNPAQSGKSRHSPGKIDVADTGRSIGWPVCTLGRFRPEVSGRSDHLHNRVWQPVPLLDLNMGRAGLM